MYLKGHNTDDAAAEDEFATCEGATTPIPVCVQLNEGQHSFESLSGLMLDDSVLVSPPTLIETYASASPNLQLIANK